MHLGSSKIGCCSIVSDDAGLSNACSCSTCKIGSLFRSKFAISACISQPRLEIPDGVHQPSLQTPLAQKFPTLAHHLVSNDGSSAAITGHNVDKNLVQVVQLRLNLCFTVFAQRLKWVAKCLVAACTHHRLGDAFLLKSLAVLGNYPNNAQRAIHTGR